jgi:hypothetical protein
MAPTQQQQQQQKPDKIVLVLIDGVGDVTIPAFGDRTPLQVAHTPNMDCVAGACRRRPQAQWLRAERVCSRAAV